MKVFIAFITLFMSVSIAFAQTHTDKDAIVKDELQKLFSQLNDAITKKDRAALERVYADEFQFIHTTGSVVEKTAQINSIMGNEPAASTPVPVPSFENMIAYSDLFCCEQRHPVRQVPTFSLRRVGGGKSCRFRERDWRPHVDQSHSNLKLWIPLLGSMSLGQMPSL